jgi:hypothetical protein
MASENDQKRMMRSGVVPVFAVLVLGVSYACSETSVAPNATSDSSFPSTGVIGAAVQDVKDGNLVYVGTVSSSVLTKKSARGFETTSDGTAPRGSMAGTASALPTAVPLGFPQLQAMSGVSASKTPGPPAVWRMRLSTPMQKIVTADGKTLSVQLVNDMRGGGRPPVSMLIHDGSRTSQFVEFKYVKDGKKWRAAEIHSTIFGDDGRPSKVITSDLRAIQQGSLNVGSRLNITPLLREIGSEFGRLIQPDVLYAATVAEDLDDEGLPNCLGSKMVVAAALGWVVAYGAGLVTVGASCVTTLITCAAWLYAVAWYELAVSTLAAVTVQLWECQHPSSTLTTRVDSGGGVPGGGGSETGGSGSCKTYKYEVSFDGGQTWRTERTWVVCQSIA